MLSLCYLHVNIHRVENLLMFKDICFGKFCLHSHTVQVNGFCFIILSYVCKHLCKAVTKCELHVDTLLISPYNAICLYAFTIKQMWKC